MQADGTIAELMLVDGVPAARMLCAPQLIPAPGKYLLAQAERPDLPPALRSSVLAISVFSARVYPDGFLAAPPVPTSWAPGMHLHLRGPLGHGFEIPASARRVALVAFDDSPRRLLALFDAAFQQGAAVALVCDAPSDDLPLPVEIQPLRALIEVCNWADYVAIDVARQMLPRFRSMLEVNGSGKARYEGQILIRTPMPCGGMAECGVCAVDGRAGHRLACEDGPVFDLEEIL